MTLKDLEIGKSAVITSVGGKGALRQHFLDMGMIPGAEVTVVKFAPMGDPMELQVHGYELTLRLAEAEQIEIEQIPKRSRSHAGIEAVSDLAPVSYTHLTYICLSSSTLSSLDFNGFYVRFPHFIGSSM